MRKIYISPICLGLDLKFRYSPKDGGVRFGLSFSDRDIKPILPLVQKNSRP